MRKLGYFVAAMGTVIFTFSIHHYNLHGFVSICILCWGKIADVPPVIHDVLRVTSPRPPVCGAGGCGLARAEVRADEEEHDGHVEHHHHLQQPAMVERELQKCNGEQNCKIFRREHPAGVSHQLRTTSLYIFANAEHRNFRNARADAEGGAMAAASSPHLWTSNFAHFIAVGNVGYNDPTVLFLVFTW